MSFLSGIVNKVISSSGLALPFSVDEKLDAPPPAGLWTLHKGTKRDDGTPLTVFSMDLNTKRDKLALAQNSLKRIKTIRHPNMIRLVESVETDSHIYVATEPVLPLTAFLRTERNESNIIMGIYKIASALKFFHTECKMVHGNIRLDSVYVTKAGEWKLFGYELLGPLNVERPLLLEMGNVMPQSSVYNPPEVQKQGMTALRIMNPPLLDSWALAALIYEIFNGSISRISQLTPTDRQSIPEKVFQLYRMLVIPDPSARGTVQQALEFGLRPGNAFDNELIHTVEFLDNISVKEQASKETFAKKVNAALEQAKLNPKNSTFPPEFLKHKLLPSLSSAVEFGGAPPNFVLIILRIGELLTPGEYETQLAPILLRLFASMDRALRITLCDHMALYIDRFSEKVVADKIWTHLQTGFNDTAPALREATVKAILTVAPKLGEKILNNDLLSLIARAQVDMEPGIRANTTICLGNLAKLLTETTRNNVLVPAFSRALLDSFPPSRVAGLRAFSTTMEYFEPSTMAKSVLPVVAPLLVDAEKSVRVQALKTHDHFLHAVKQHASTMPDAPRPLPSNNLSNANSLPSAGSVVSSGATAASTKEGQKVAAQKQGDSWSNWAGSRLHDFAGSAMTKLAGVDDLDWKPAGTAATAALAGPVVPITPNVPNGFSGALGASATPVQVKPLTVNSPGPTGLTKGMQLPKAPKSTVDSSLWDKPAASNILSSDFKPAKAPNATPSLTTSWDSFAPSATAAVSSNTSWDTYGSKSSASVQAAVGWPAGASPVRTENHTLTKGDSDFASSWDPWATATTSGSSKPVTDWSFADPFSKGSETTASDPIANATSFSTSWDSFQANPPTTATPQTFTVNLNLKPSSKQPTRKY